MIIGELIAEKNHCAQLPRNSRYPSPLILRTWSRSESNCALLQDLRRQMGLWHIERNSQYSVLVKMRVHKGYRRSIGNLIVYQYSLKFLLAPCSAYRIRRERSWTGRADHGPHQSCLWQMAHT